MHHIYHNKRWKANKVTSIFEYLPLLPLGPKLIPEVDTREGNLVSQWREKFNKLQIEKLTFGVAVNKELQLQPVKMRAGMTKEGLTFEMYLLNSSV